MSTNELVHATTVSIDGHGVLISGPSGSGKSDLALRLIDRGATLVADDQTLIRVEAGAALASSPATIAGKLEVRGLGILSFEHEVDIPLSLSISLAETVERMPEARTRQIAGVVIPDIFLDPRPASAPIKVELMVRHKEPRA